MKIIKEAIKVGMSVRGTDMYRAIKDQTGKIAQVNEAGIMVEWDNAALNHIRSPWTHWIYDITDIGAIKIIDPDYEERALDQERRLKYAMEYL